MAVLVAAAWASGTAETAWWWLTNDQPPTIEASLPSGPIRASGQTTIVVRPTGRAWLATAQLDDAPLTPQPTGSHSLLDLDTTRLPDGDHLIRLEAVDTSRRRNRTTLELRFTSDNTPPSVTLEGAPNRLRAGQPAAIRLAWTEPADVTAEWDGEPLPLLLLSQAPTARLALVALPPTRPTGAVALRLAARDVAGNAADERFELPVDAATLPRQNLFVPASLAPLATGPVTTAETAQIFGLTSAVRTERSWTGEFRPPLTGIRTTGFGDRRDYADGYVASHSGYDVAAPERTPVLAAAHGIVVFTGALPQRGNTIIVDHGWGVYSLYAHLSEVPVTEGQQVAQGQTVGLVGNTGLSTGPHLHWEIRLRGQPVDPDGWIALTRSLP